MASKIYAVVAGVGPGTGASVARKFSEAYPVVVLARTPESYNSLVTEINNKGGSAFGVPTDLSNADSVKNAFQTIDEKFGKDSSIAVSTFSVIINAHHLDH